MFTDRKVSGYFISDREMEHIVTRIELLEKVMSEVNSNSEWVVLAKGHVWKWFKMYLWRPVLLERNLSDEGKLRMLRMCVLEKVKYQNTSDRTMRRFIRNGVFELKRNEKMGSGGVGLAGTSPQMNTPAPKCEVARAA